MQQGYYKYDNRALAFKYGSPEHKFYDYLIRKENFSRMKGLEIGQVEITVRTVAKDIEVTEMLARRLIKQFIDYDFMRLIYKSNSKEKPSIYILKTYEENNTVENTVENTDRTQLNEHITSVDGIEEHGLDTVENTVNNTSKKEYIKRINKKNIYNGQNEFDLSISKNQAYKENIISGNKQVNDEEQICSNKQDNNIPLEAYEVTDKKEKRKNSAQKKRESKHKYGEYNHVLLTDKEKDKLIEELGEDKFTLCIKKLDEYIEIKGKKYNNHNLVIRKWVIESVEKDLKKNLVQEQEVYKVNIPPMSGEELIDLFTGGGAQDGIV